MLPAVAPNRRRALPVDTDGHVGVPPRFDAAGFRSTDVLGDVVDGMQNQDRQFCGPLGAQFAVLIYDIPDGGHAMFVKRNVRRCGHDVSLLSGIGPCSAPLRGTVGRRGTTRSCCVPKSNADPKSYWWIIDTPGRIRQPAGAHHAR